MFGIAKSVKSRVCDCTPELFRKAIDDPLTGRVCAEIADALEMVKRGEMTRDEFETKKTELKKQLPVLTPHATYTDGCRTNKSAVPSGLSIYDIDHINDPRGYYQHMVADRLGELGIVLAHVTPSNEGLRLLFVVPAGMSLAEAQKWMSKQLNDTNYDGSVKDLARCSFLVPRDYILYLDEEELFAERIPQVQCAECRVQGEKVEEKKEEATETNLVEEPTAASLLAFDLCAKQAGLNAESMDVWGEHNWHTNLMAVLSVGVAKLMTRQQLQAVVAQRLPNYSQTDDCRILIEYFYEKYDANKGFMNASLREINAKAQEKTFSDSPLKGEEDEMEEQSSNREIVKLSNIKLPIGLKESLVGIPESMHMPVLCAVMPIAATYADGVEVEYCDGMIHRLGLMSIIRGGQASNKSICKTVVDVWKRQFDKEDALAREREDVWKDRKKGRKANEKAPDDPKVLIRVVPVTISCSTLLKRFKYAPGHCLYSFGEELDTLRKTNGAGSWSSKYDIYRMGFDYGEWGQDYNSDQAESGNVRVAYNWTMLGTYGAVRRCFKQDNIENGLSGRVLMAEMPDGAFARLTKFRRRSEADEERIQEAVTRLRSYSGFIDTPRLRRTIDKWVEEKRVIAAKNIDYVMDVYRRRAAVIGFRCGVIFRLLEGRESNASLKFAITIAEYCMEQQIKAFGELLQSSQQKDGMEDKKKTLNNSIFEQLPSVFGMGDLKALKHGDCSDDSLRSVISRWRRDEWVEKIDSKHWKKRIL